MSIIKTVIRAITYNLISRKYVSMDVTFLESEAYFKKSERSLQGEFVFDPEEISLPARQ